MSTDGINDLLQSAVASGVAPGVAAIAVTRGRVLYEGAAGHARVAEGVPMALDSMFSIASMTKAITSVCALQAVDRGLLALDAPASDVLPELSDLRVLAGDGSIRPASRPVTLRHLLTHTSGFAYPFTSPALGAHLQANPALPGEVPPLVSDPGERWQYGTSTDWAGRMIERVTGKDLQAVMREQLLGPLGMDDTSYDIAPANIERLCTIHNRVSETDFDEQPFRVPAPPPSYGGGGGLTSTARDYAKFIQFMLNGGVADGVRLVSDSAMEGLRTNHAGDVPSGSWQTGSPSFSYDADLSMGGTSRHSLGFLLSTRNAPSGRAAGSLRWAGIFNTYYWIDPARDIGGAVFMQYLPFADPRALTTLGDFEREVYAAFG